MNKKPILAGLIVSAICVAGYLIGTGTLVAPHSVGTVNPVPIPNQVVNERTSTQHTAAKSIGATSEKQVLFGDFHVHSTFSKDAFSWSLPIMNGEGAHPVADACDFARYCSALDFWSINDHAEHLSPRMWAETKTSIEQCNAVTNTEQPDVVAFLGYEWTQVGDKPENHYGHKNVIYRDIVDQNAQRPILAKSTGWSLRDLKTPFIKRVMLPLSDAGNIGLDMLYNRHADEINATPDCPDNINIKDLPLDCRAGAKNPDELYRQLDNADIEHIVIPHGNSWGIYTPAGSTWDKQLKGLGVEKQSLIEIYSGHGNSEEYRPWRAIAHNDNGEAYCPEPTSDYLPMCWRAGEIIQARCLKAGESKVVCEQRAVDTRDNYLANWVVGRETVSGTTLNDWLDAGQCKDCFQETFSHRPGTSTQYGLAISNFDDPENPKRFRFGFIASSDNHRARPGTGYKEYKRHAMTEMNGPRSAFWYKNIYGPNKDPIAETATINRSDAPAVLQAMARQFERSANFLYTGGLMAVHANSRDKEGIWQAIDRKEVYGTSGERMLLWFDLLNAPEAPDGLAVPMGSETRMQQNPRFRVRAIGAFKQKSGCPEYSTNALTPDRLETLCRGECYNPSDKRKLITRIEVIRIRPQITPDESVDGLIEDVWKTFDCPADQNGCLFEFEDPEFNKNTRDTVYYVRAIEEPTPLINGNAPRCEYNDKGQCLQANSCNGSYLQDKNDDCLALDEPRAWSSPIYVDFDRMITANSL